MYTWTISFDYYYHYSTFFGDWSNCFVFPLFYNDCCSELLRGVWDAFHYDGPSPWADRPIHLSTCSLGPRPPRRGRFIKREQPIWKSLRGEGGHWSLGAYNVHFEMVSCKHLKMHGNQSPYDFDLSFVLLMNEQNISLIYFCTRYSVAFAYTPWIVKGNKSLNLVWFEWGSQWWGILKHFPQSRCILISHWSREKEQTIIII